MNVAIIPARGGSTRIPRKNIKPFLGVPMLVRAIETARVSKIFSKIYVSTEDREIAEGALSVGAGVVMRPEPLAQNAVGTQEVMRDAVCHLGLNGLDEVCCLYPCTPLLTVKDLQWAHQPNRPGYTITVSDAHGGDIGWFYLGYAHWFREGKPLWTAQTSVYPIEAERAIDINTPEDWARAEAVYQKLRRAA